MKVRKKIRNRVFPVLLAFIMVFSMIPTAVFGADEAAITDNAPQFSDMPDNWSTTALQNAVANGLLGGADGKIMPNQNLTRAQMATVITRAFGAADKGDLSGFADVKSSDWFSDSLAKAYQMGVIKGSNGTMSPNSAITRQEVFVILARAFKLQPAETVSKTFSDANQIAEWAKGEVYAFVNEGYIQGAGGKLNPKNLISRAEFAQIFDNILKQYINKAGEYTQVAAGNVMINVPGVTLKNLKVTGDLIIGDGVGDGEVALDSVEVTGRMVIRGGGENSIIIRGNSNVSHVVVARVDGVVSVKVQGDADVEVIYIDDGSDDVNVEGTFGNIDIAAPDIVVKAVGATIQNVDVAGAGARIIVDSASKISSVKIQAPNTQISGTGTVTKVEAQAGATGSKIETPNTQISVGAGVSGVTGGGNAPVSAGTTLYNNTTGSGTTPSQAPPPSGGGGNGPRALPTLTVNEVTVNSATSVTFSSIAAPSAVIWNGTVVPAGNISYNANIVTIAVPKITSITNTLVVSAAGYTSTSKSVAITQSNENIKLIANTAQLENAILNQAEGQSWLIKNGTYTTQRFDSINVGGQKGWYFPITASDINITGESKSGVILTSDAQSPNGNWSSQDHVSVWGDHVTIENLTIKPKITTNKTVEVMGRNFTIRNVDFVQRNDTTYQFAGSLFFNPNNGDNDIGNSLVENVLINDAWISCSPKYVSAGALTIKNTTIDFRGSAYANYPDYGVFSKNDAISILVADGSFFRVLADNAPNLQTQILDRVPAGATVVLEAGTYYMTAAPIVPTGVTLDTASNNAVIEILDENTVLVRNDSEFKTALNGTASTIRMTSGTYEFDSHIRITRAVNIIGSGDSTIITKGDTAWTNTTGSKGYAPMITIHSGENAVSLENIKVTGAKNIPMTGKTDYGSGINVVSSSNVILKNVTSVANDAAGLIVNSSSVSAINLNTSSNGWYGVNVDKADSGNADFTLSGNGVIAEPIQIISDKTVGASVTAEGYAQYTLDDTGKTRWHKGENKNIASITDGGTTKYYETIQAAISAATTGQTVLIAEGTYDFVKDALNINRAITVAGISMEDTILKGGSGISATVNLSAGATLRNLTVTRDNSGAWSTNLNSSLVSFVPNLTADTTLDNCIITQGRNGVYMNNSGTNGFKAIITNNKIFDTRTGINFTGNCNGIKINDNEITGCWTIGIVHYNLGDAGTDLDTINLKDNKIKDNWLGQILIKTPQPTDAESNLITGLLDISFNDFGGTYAGEIQTVTIATAYSPSHEEPAYNDQQPVSVGGTATIPTWTPPTIRIYKQPDAGITGPGILLEAYVDGDEGTVNVSTEAQLKAALVDTSFTNINLTADISVTAMLKVTRAISIDGKGHKLTVTTDLGEDNASKHALDIFADNVTIKDLTIDSNSLAFGVQAYEANNVSLDNVSLKNSNGAGLTVNGSSVTANDLDTSGNDWGGVNVDPGDGVTDSSVFTLTGSGTLGETVQIWSDGDHVTSDTTATVHAEGYTQYEIAGNTIWSKSEFQAVTDITGVPDSGTVETEIDLTTAIVGPADATNKTIEWTVKDAGETGVTDVDLEDGKFTPASAGTLTLTATIANGETAVADYTQDFTITIAE